MTTTTVTSPVTTRTLLAAAALAAPVWVVVSLAQAFTRAGFDLTRHPLSQLATGELGWIQIATFVTVGVLFIAGATGLRRALHGRPGGVWTPRLIRVVGVGMIAAGAFTMDAGDGFPVGTPAGPPAGMSWHAIAHMAAGSITFLALAAAGFVLGRHFARTGDRTSAIISRVAGVAVILGNGWTMGGGPMGSLTLAIGVSVALAWVSTVAYRLRNRT
ncbi:DUF998 domain-containing protein [Nonomuraea sp. NPDC050540]|uniref:DUF998 domain-containing protein n=1 Tax=Nonomuraea sp. NPDC050540 TaxID=3364367 RepID=UPI00378DFAC4